MAKSGFLYDIGKVESGTRDPEKCKKYAKNRWVDQTWYHTL